MDLRNPAGRIFESKSMNSTKSDSLKHLSMQQLVLERAYFQDVIWFRENPGRSMRGRPALPEEIPAGVNASHMIAVCITGAPAFIVHWARAYRQFLNMIFDKHPKSAFGDGLAAPYDRRGGVCIVYVLGKTAVDHCQTDADLRRVLYSGTLTDCALQPAGAA